MQFKMCYTNLTTWVWMWWYSKTTNSDNNTKWYGSCFVDIIGFWIPWNRGEYDISGELTNDTVTFIWMKAPICQYAWFIQIFRMFAHCSQSIGQQSWDRCKLQTTDREKLNLYPTLWRRLWNPLRLDSEINGWCTRSTTQIITT